MARYVSSYHIEKRKRLLIQISAGVGVLLVLGILFWAIGGDSGEQNPEPQNENPISSPRRETETSTVAESKPEPEPEKIVEPKPEPTVVESKYVDDSVSADEKIKIALSLERTKPVEARNILNDVLIQSKLSPEQTKLVMQKLSSLADYWLFSRTVFPNDHLCENYTVKSGDYLGSIARKYKVPYQILMQINGIANERSLMAGQRIKVIKGPFHAKVTMSTFTVDVFLQKYYVKSFKAGLGKEGRETPTGYWVVKSGGKMIEPEWWDDELKKNFKPSDPDYPLGTRWIELHGLEGAGVGRTGIAFHGTHEDESIGTKCSRGCIRLLNKDVELLYKLLESGESNVLIVD